MEQQHLLKKHFGNYLVILLFVIVGFVLYVNTFQNQMFWDDNDSILQNQYIKEWRYFPNFFSENFIAGAGFLNNYWRPILLLVFSLEWHFWQDWPPGYHFVNASFHITNAILLFLILFYIFKNRWLAFFTALVFLVHPLQTEAVTYISGLADPLSVFFIFLGIFFYIKFRALGKAPLKSIFYFLSLIMYALALMSKESAIIMPALIFIVDFFFLSRHREEFSFKTKLKEIGKAILPFFILASIYFLLRATALNFINTFNFYSKENTFTSNFYVRLFTFFRVLTIYFGLLLWPFNLHMERDVEIATSLFSPLVILGGFIFLGLLVLAFSQFKRFPILSFGILWFFIGLAPTSNLFIPISGLLSEHWLYIPIIGIFLILIWLGILIGKRYNLQKILLGILIVFLIFLSVLTINRNKDWANPITFYNQTLKYAPNSYRIINNLGMAYADKKDYQRAEKIYQKAISLDPSGAVAYHNLGDLYKTLGKINLAIENFNTAIKLDPKFIFSYNALLSIYGKNKNYQEARKILESYLDYSDSKIDVLLLLAQITAEEKDFKTALSYLEKAIVIDPENQFIQAATDNIKNLIESQK